MACSGDVTTCALLTSFLAAAMACGIVLGGTPSSTAADRLHFEVDVDRANPGYQGDHFSDAGGAA